MNSEIAKSVCVWVIEAVVDMGAAGYLTDECFFFLDKETALKSLETEIVPEYRETKKGATVYETAMNLTVFGYWMYSQHTNNVWNVVETDLTIFNPDGTLRIHYDE